MSSTPNEQDVAALAAALNTMTEAFLRWPLPESVCADLCATKQGPGRIGTNLLSFTEARQMLSDLVAPELRRLQSELDAAKEALAEKDEGLIVAHANVQTWQDQYQAEHSLVLTCYDQLREERKKIETLIQADNEHAHGVRGVCEQFAAANQRVAQLEQELLSSKARSSELESKVHMRVDKVRARQIEGGEVWIWSGDGEDHPDSLTCPVIVQAEQVRKWDKAEADNARLRAALGLYDVWPLFDVLSKLCEAVRHLRIAHECDYHGHEQFYQALEAGERLIPQIKAALATPGDAAGEEKAGV
jgi:hypothetical protein